MFRFCLATAAGFVLAANAPAATWAEAMFDELVRDFGSVPRGPMLTHSYRLTNNTGHAVHVASVRVSCGCVSATAMQGALAPGQSTVVLAQMDTRRFTGPKTVTIYVQFDQPRWEEVRLSISANGRDDLTITPEAIAFGAVPRGSTAAKTTTVTILGGSTQLASVQADSNYVQLAAKGVRNTGAELVYEVTATLRPDTPVGKWYTDVWLNTNNPAAPRIRVPLTVDVESALSVSPAQAAFGAVKAGESAEKRVIVRGGQPFKITAIEGGDDTVSAEAADQAEAKPAHVVVVRVKAGAAGDLSRTLKIVTDLSGEGTAELPVRATVQMPKSE